MRTTAPDMRSISVVPSALAILLLVLAACGGPARLVTAGASPEQPPTWLPTPAAGTPTTAGTSFSSAGCHSPGRAVPEQSMNGVVSSCIRVGAVHGGTYAAVLEQVISRRTTSLATNPAPSPAGKASSAPAASPVRLALSPASGPPGTKVVVTGTLASPPAHRHVHANLCWDGCRLGLQYSGVLVHWASPTTFTTHLVVPAAPWIEGSPPRVAALSSGTYAIGAQCLAATSGCGGNRSDGTASFHLSVPPSVGPPWCKTGASCADLHLSATSVLPGDVVKVTGFAPLVSVMGSHLPFVSQFNVVPGPVTGPEVRFAAPNAKGAVVIRLGHAAIAVRAPATFAGLARTAPIAPGATQRDGLAPISGGPAGSGLVAWCARQAVAVTGPSGMATVSTRPVATVLRRLGFGPLGNGGPACTAVAPIGTSHAGLPAVGTHPQALAAAFVGAPGGVAPPAADAALFTLDGGRSWSPVPVPPGASAATFGGFRYRGTALEALFAPKPADASAPAQRPTLVEMTTDGGRNWHSTSLACPSQGPCTSFGPYVQGNCAMNGTGQDVLTSADGGLSWSRPAWPDLVQACAPAELVATSGSSELLLDSGSSYMLRRSTNGGRTWSYVALPPLPGQDQAAGLGPGAGGITMLPDGSILATGQRGSHHSWQLLRHGATSWCRPRGLPAGSRRATEFQPVVVIGNQLWWLSGNGTPAPPRAPHHVAVGQIAC
ncbi:MAG: hypothetical protein ACYDH5_11330 [Acidimicrobiales bacterium]